MSQSGATAWDLRGSGRILLISCYELGHPPHTLAMAQGFLERAGFAPECVDISVERLTDAQLTRARLAVVSVPMHTALRLGVRAAQRIKLRSPDTRICFTGLYAPLNAAYLGRVGIDWVLGGESEAALVALVEALERNPAMPAGTSPEPAAAMSALPAAITLAKLDIPQPSRRGFLPLVRYARLDDGSGQLRLAGYTETSRGCLDTCRHCPVPAVYGGRFFVIDPEVVLADIAAEVERGARHITFGDPDFFNGPRHGMAILRRMHARWPELTFDITAQVSHLVRDRQYLAELAELGCVFVVSAVESLSDRVLTRLRKRHRRADVEQAVELTRSAGLALRPTFVAFTPWTRLEDMRELVDFVADRELVEHVDPVQLTIRLLVPPGSLLLQEPDTRSAFGELDCAALTHTWRHPDPRMDALQRDLARCAEAGAKHAHDPADTFATMRDAVYQAQGEQPPARAMVPRARKRVPRLTEPWFC